MGHVLRTIDPKDFHIGTYKKPNVRSWFIPDSGQTIFDVDLKQADAQVVAWDSGDEALKEIFRSGEDLHRQNCIDIFGEFSPHGRQIAKVAVHAANYRVKARTLAKALNVNVNKAAAVLRRWYKLHPAITQWHDRIETQLNETRIIYNAFGYRYVYLGRLNESAVKEMLAWIAQSTVAEVINRGMKNIDANIPEIQLLMQVHDSLVGQFPDPFYPKRNRIHDETRVVVPYPDRLIIGRDIACSRRSWGHVKAVPWTNEDKYCVH